MTEALWLLLLISAVAAGAFYAGWRSADAYLQAARAVSEVTNAVATQSNVFAAALDRATAENVLLRKALDQNTETLNARLADFEAGFGELFQGFERAGIVRRGRGIPGKQVGETGPE